MKHLNHGLYGSSSTLWSEVIAQASGEASVCERARYLKVPRDSKTEGTPVSLSQTPRLENQRAHHDRPSTQIAAVISTMSSTGQWKVLPAYLLRVLTSTWKALKSSVIASIAGRAAKRHGHGDPIESAAAFEKACANHPQVFRFMDLPKEIRLLIYEQCDIQTKHYDIATDNDKKHLDDSCAALVVSSFPSIKLLQTCSTVRDEAILIFQRNQLKRLSDEPIRLFFKGSCALNYTVYVTDIVLLMAGLLNNSATAPQYPDLGCWLHAHSWGPDALPSGHPLQLLLPGSPRKGHTRLIVCADFGIPPADANFWSAAIQINGSETVKLCFRLPWDEEVFLRAPGMIHLHLRLQSLSNTPSRSTWIGEPFHDAVHHNFPRHYVTFGEGDFVELGEWQRDWVESV
ncbi:hypothetical protein P171DRAFT_429615 [Karstenula rhodostoma CBS 690.94]|uniref:F-box domain-containing protein n=1 Tax=Karstenula rhodostoma CBS 690.94 TaxID=1392251 RepID=A0A9P4PQ03_9PLEO|nr:hypothetical protein P171DRAFT_429615 [Karstenula rhodostoma CBS 690.94]